MVSESVSCPVSMMIGALKPPLRRLRTTSLPSVSGKPTSISTKSGELALAALAPLAPVSTAEASNSSCSDNCSTSVSRRSLSSSTIRILRALGIGYDPLEAGGGHRGSVKPGLRRWQPDWLARFTSKPGRQVLIRIEVSGCYRFTSRTTVYPKFEARLDECPVMASLGQFRPDRQSQNSDIDMESNAISITYKTTVRDQPLAVIQVRRAA